MHIKVSEMSRKALNWAVAEALNPGAPIFGWDAHRGEPVWTDYCDASFTMSLAKMEFMVVGPTPDRKAWMAFPCANRSLMQLGDAPEVAVARCFVASRLGEMVRAPG